MKTGVKWNSQQQLFFGVSYSHKSLVFYLRFAELNGLLYGLKASMIMIPWFVVVEGQVSLGATND